jgi:hypothetical protein
MLHIVKLTRHVRLLFTRSLESEATTRTKLLYI